MGVTRFPNGVEVGDSTTAATLSIGGTTIHPVGASADGYRVGALAGTAITGLGTVSASALGLTSATAAVSSLGGTAAGWAGTAVGNPAYVKAHCASGNVIVRIFDATGVQATNAGTVGIVAHGS